MTAVAGAVLTAVWDWGFYFLLGCDWLWTIYSGRVRRAVPGSLAQHAAMRGCRIFRYPGFLLWPFWGVQSAWWVLTTDSMLLRVVCSLTLLMSFFATRSAWRRLRQQIKDDDDDPWNKAGRALKKLGRSVSAALTPAPLGAPT